MKKLLFITLLTFCIYQTNAQPWIKSVRSTNPTLNDYQKAFYDYWKPFNVKSGYYIKDGVKTKASGWNQFKRWENYWEPRVGESGIFPENNVNAKEWLKNKNKDKNILGNSWIPLGPTEAINPFGENRGGGVGRVNCIAFHPFNENILWAGTPAGGLWKTVDGGQTWSTNYDNMPSLGVSSIAINPINPDTMYIATGDGDGWLAGNLVTDNKGDTRSIGILKSTDGGINWEQVFAPNDLENIVTPKIIINPLNPNILFVASSLGILMTKNSGLTWENVQSGEFIDIEFHPTNKNIIYASTYNYGNSQVFVSNDGGNNWQQTTNFIGIRRINIEVTPNDENMVELLCANYPNSGLDGIYRSTDSGNNWTKYYSGVDSLNLLNISIDAFGIDGQGWYDLSFAIDPTNKNNVFVGGINTWKSTDAGKNWELSNYWTSHPFYNTTGFTEIVHADKHFFAFHPLNSSILFECNDGGIAKSIDGGKTWTEISKGLAISQAYRINSSPFNNINVCVGLQDNGSLVYTDPSWVTATGADGMNCFFDYGNPQFLYTSEQQGRINRINLVQFTYDVISENLPGGQQEAAWITPFQLDPINSNIIYACYKEVYKSVDMGDTWTQLSNLGTSTFIQHIDVAKSNTDFIYISTYHNILLSKDGGISWTNITGILPVSTLRISSIKVNPNNENNLFVTISGYDSANKVFLTDDAGQTWTNITGTGLTTLPVNCLELNTNNNDIYVGTDEGVYISNNFGAEWYKFGSDLPNVIVADLEIHYPSSKLRAGTFGRGIWEIDLSTLSNKTIELAKNDIVVFPNPSNGIINLPEGFENSDYEIISNIGVVVKTGKLENSLINISDFSTGIYYVRIKDASNGNNFSIKILKK